MDTRRVPIERTLAPLLEAWHSATGGKGNVSPIAATDEKLSRQLQRCLRLAGVAGAELFVDDETRRAITSTTSARRASPGPRSVATTR